MSGNDIIGIIGCIVLPASAYPVINILHKLIRLIDRRIHHHHLRPWWPFILLSVVAATAGWFAFSLLPRTIFTGNSFQDTFYGIIVGAQTGPAQLLCAPISCLIILVFEEFRWTVQYYRLGYLLLLIPAFAGALSMLSFMVTLILIAVAILVGIIMMFSGSTHHNPIIVLLFERD